MMILICQVKVVSLAQFIVTLVVNDCGFWFLKSILYNYDKIFEGEKFVVTR